jgi:hypothetical protein
MDKRYSLAFVAHDAGELAARCDAHADGSVKAMGYPLSGTTVYCLYTHTGASGTTADLETTEAEIAAALDEMHPDDRTIAIRLLNIYEGVLDEEDKAGDGLEIYKELEMDNLPRALAQVDWSGTATEIAGRLMSNLILKHALPNANHRCSISLLETYLEFCSREDALEFSMPYTHTPAFEWHEWVNEYIRESKRILTIRRNNVRFDALRDAGCEVVVRKGDIGIHLAEWDLDMHYREAWTEYAQLHEHLCIGFAQEVTRRGGAPALGELSGLTKQEFASLLRE